MELDLSTSTMWDTLQDKIGGLSSRLSNWPVRATEGDRERTLIRLWQRGRFVSDDYLIHIALRFPTLGAIRVCLSPGLLYMTAICERILRGPNLKKWSRNSLPRSSHSVSDMTTVVYCSDLLEHLATVYIQQSIWIFNRICIHIHSYLSQNV